MTGARWPDVGQRLAMLEESVEVIRALWAGDVVDHHGEHYTVENARLYTLPGEPPPVYVSAFGRRAAEVAARIGDGLMIVTPDAETIDVFRERGGAGKPVHAGAKVCWGQDESTALTAVHTLWPNDSLPGELAQVLPSPRHFEQASTLVTSEMVAGSTALGPDPDRHVETLRQYADAGVGRGTRLPDRR